jgi:hypothetical protein
MGFHKRIINKEMSFSYLLKEDLKSLYDAESIIITDDFSSFIRDLYLQKKTEKEILELLNYNQNEVYQSGQTN